MSTDNLVNVLSSYSRNLRSNRIIVSVCTGRSGTELQGDDLCLCMDIDKRSLFNSAMTARYLSKSKSTVFYHQDMREKLDLLLVKIRKVLQIPVVVLFQHPNPKDVDAVTAAGRACTRMLMSDVIEQVVVVYDVHPGKNCWSYAHLSNAIIGKEKTKSYIQVSHPVVICERNAVEYHHPLFGNITRSGWALMKKGDEIAFHVTRT